MTPFEKSINILSKIAPYSRKQFEIFLNTTFNCPLKCKYCYVDQSNPNGLSYEQVEYIIEKLCMEPKRKFVKLIGFFGGEPLLKVDIIERIIEKFYNHPSMKNITFGVITSFSVNQDRLLRLHDKYPLFDIVISYDVDNSERVLHNGKPFDMFKSSNLSLKDLSKYNKNIVFQKIITGREKKLENDLVTLHKIYNDYKIMYSFGLDKTPLNVNYDNVLYGVLEYLKSILLDIFSGRQDFYIPKLIATFILSYRNKVLGEQLFSGCGIGQNLFIDGAGNISLCSISYHTNSFIVKEGIYDKDIAEYYTNLETNYLNNEMCKSCRVAGFCKGGCLIYRYEQHGKYDIPNSEHCKLISAIYDAFDFIMSHLTEDQKNKIYFSSISILSAISEYCHDFRKRNDFQSTIMNIRR